MGEKTYADPEPGPLLSSVSAPMTATWLSIATDVSNNRASAAPSEAGIWV